MVRGPTCLCGRLTICPGLGGKPPGAPGGGGPPAPALNGGLMGDPTGAPTGAAPAPSGAPGYLGGGAPPGGPPYGGRGGPPWGPPAPGGATDMAVKTGGAGGRTVRETVFLNTRFKIHSKQSRQR